ncbi:MAG: phosphohydrolase [Flavobacteriaceae bacterium]|nr:phosphohydrolase [Flavobacteriaceae bacterium]|tara:strand:+ start:23541 stop:25601 length:2061 start_codon:yes stop_codon:yes gene_type:complete
MSDFMNKVYKNNTIIYKVLLFLLTTVAIVYLFPKGGQFKYEFSNGQVWRYDNLYAPFDYAIQKSEDEITIETKTITANSKLYFLYDQSIVDKVNTSFKERVARLEPTDSLPDAVINSLALEAERIIQKVYANGYVEAISENRTSRQDELIAVRKNNEVSDTFFKDLYTNKEVLALINTNLSDTNLRGKFMMVDLLADIMKPNVFYDDAFTQRIIDKKIEEISYTKGKVTSGELIILKGDVVEGNKLEMLRSLKSESESKVWTESNYNWIVFGYTTLVSLALLMLLLFLNKYRIEIFNDNNKVTFIFINILLMIFIQTMVIKYNSDYLYVVPLSILPIVLKAFFDARLGLFAHVLTVLLLGFIVPNSFEFIYLHIIAGIVTILTVSELYKRANIFISVAQITVIYMITYFAFSIIKEGNASQLNFEYFLLFSANGLLSFLSIILIYIYEKLFGLVSDVTLLELSNTNSKLLRELNEKAPGTFQHSMQVANLAEAAANEIGANSMLVRTGALYHDIGKIYNPQYFTENQSTSVNPHNELSPQDSARIIIDHVIRGIEMAKKYKLPDRVIDFIRTHHGTSTTYYFYSKEVEANPDSEVDKKKFQYKGPIPFSRETAILMMCDAAEAASKSLKTPTAEKIDNLIERIVNKQLEDNQFQNSNITLREIELIKKVIKKKLMNIYHVRVEYPE